MARRRRRGTGSGATGDAVLAPDRRAAPGWWPAPPGAGQAASSAGDPRRRLDHLLEVVEHQQEPAFAERGGERLGPGGMPGASRTPSAWAIAGRTRAGSRSGARSTKTTPSGNAGAAARAASIASRVLPTPPGPVSVTRRWARQEIDDLAAPRRRGRGARSAGSAAGPDPTAPAAAGVAGEVESTATPSRRSARSTSGSQSSSGRSSTSIHWAASSQYARSSGIATGSRSSGRIGRSCFQARATSWRTLREAKAAAEQQSTSAPLPRIAATISGP